MFSVKWIVRTPHGSIYRMYEAEDIAVAYRDGVPGSTSPGPWTVDGRDVNDALLILDPYGSPGDRFTGRSFDTGTVYVMNETGATVGKFVLSDEIVADAQPLPVAA